MGWACRACARHLRGMGGSQAQDRQHQRSGIWVRAVLHRPADVRVRLHHHHRRRHRRWAERCIIVGWNAMDQAAGRHRMFGCFCVSV